jgi:hypothetical protein
MVDPGQAGAGGGGAAGGAFLLLLLAGLTAAPPAGAGAAGGSGSSSSGQGLLAGHVVHSLQSCPGHLILLVAGTGVLVERILYTM